MKSFKEYLQENEVRIVHPEHGTFIDYEIKSKSRSIPFDYVWLDVIKTPEGAKNQNGGTERASYIIRSIDYKCQKFLF